MRQTTPESDRPSTRSVKPLPSDLLADCTTYLEEQLFSQGFAALSAALSAGDETRAPAFVPPPQHVALAATISVHPQFTSRTDQGDRLLASKTATRLLRQLSKLTDGTKFDVAEAFQFHSVGRGINERDQRAKLRRSAVDSSTNDARIEQHIQSPYATERSLFRCAGGFWHVVGWAFNCSVNHPARWSAWMTWLRLMLDILENDLERYIKARALHEDCTVPLLHQYLSSSNSGGGVLRRVLRAVLADGSEASTAEFPEIWRNETRSPNTPHDPMPRKRYELDLDNGTFADYLDGESDDDLPLSGAGRAETTSDAQRIRPGGTAAARSSADEGALESKTPRLANGMLGGEESMQIRQRFFGLLFQYYHRTTLSSLDSEDFIQLLAEFIRPLSVDVFSQLVLPLKPYLSQYGSKSLDEALCKILVGSCAPSSSNASDPRIVFEMHYALQSASNNTAADNAKVSLVIESMLRGLWTQLCMSPPSQTVLQALEAGVAARSRKVAESNKKNGRKQAVDHAARLCLDQSTLRIRAWSGGNRL